VELKENFLTLLGSLLGFNGSLFTHRGENDDVWERGNKLVMSSK
jgi:hypothetical protein